MKLRLVVNSLILIFFSSVLVAEPLEDLIEAAKSKNISLAQKIVSGQPDLLRQAIKFNINHADANSINILINLEPGLSPTRMGIFLLDALEKKNLDIISLFIKASFSQRKALSSKALYKLLEYIVENDAKSLVEDAINLIKQPNLENHYENLFASYLFKIGRDNLFKQFIEIGLQNKNLDHNFVFNTFIKNAANLSSNKLMFEIFKIIKERNLLLTNILGKETHYTPAFMILDTLINNENLTLFEFFLKQIKGMNLNKILSEVNIASLVVSILNKHPSWLFPLVDAGLNPNMQVMFGLPIGHWLAIKNFPLLKAFLAQYKDQIDDSSISAIKKAIRLKYPADAEQMIRLAGLNPDIKE